MQTLERAQAKELAAAEKEIVLMSKRLYEIEGQSFSTLEEFAEHFSKVVLSDYDWHGNLDAFDDILIGGYGTPDQGFILVWKDSNISRERLGYSETARQLRKRLETCHPSNRGLVASELEMALQHTGSTVFDWLVEIIQGHQDIELRLE